MIAAIQRGGALEGSFEPGGELPCPGAPDGAPQDAERHLGDAARLLAARLHLPHAEGHDRRLLAEHLAARGPTDHAGARLAATHGGERARALHDHVERVGGLTRTVEDVARRHGA